MTATEEIALRVNPFVSDSDSPFNERSQRIEKANYEIDDAVRSAYEIFSPQLRSFPPLPALSPEQIDMVLQLIRGSYPIEDAQSVLTGMMLNRLILQSVEKLGHHEFILHTGDCMIPHLASFEPYEITVPLDIRIIGNVGNGSGSNLKSASLTIEGGAGDNFANKCIDSTVTVRKDVGIFCGFAASRSDITIYGNAGLRLGANAYRATITVYGGIDGSVLLDAKNSIFRTPDEALFQDAVYLKDMIHNNKVQLIGDDGTVIKERK